MKGRILYESGDVKPRRAKFIEKENGVGVIRVRVEGRIGSLCVGLGFGVSVWEGGRALEIDSNDSCTTL